jgi:RNA polymerase sigma factor (sigma-70 family)
LVAAQSDEKIMNRVKSGDISELTELFERYHVKLYNYFLKLSFDKTASEDLTQNLFYRVIRYRHSFDPKNGSFKSWLYQIARNIHADHYEDQQKRKDRFPYEEGIHENIPGNNSEHRYSEDRIDRLNLALKELNIEQREIIVLSRYQGLKYDEIAKLKDSTVAAVKVQVHRAIKQLKKIYFKNTLSGG